MKCAIITRILALTILLVGCGKKLDSPKGVATPSDTQGEATSSPASHPVLTTWQQGDKTAAVTNFLATDWSSRPLFADGSILSLSEVKFRTFSAADREAKANEMMPQLLLLRDLAQAVEKAGQDAAAKGDNIQARKYFESLKQFGTALDSPDYTFMQRQVGQAIQKLGEKNLAQIGQ